MSNKVRKVSIGPDYKDAMHFTVGQSVLGQSHTIHSIKIGMANQMQKQVIVYIQNDSNEVYPWKSFIGTPFSVEYDIEFDSNERDL